MKFNYDIEKAREVSNFAEEMSDEDLDKIGQFLKGVIQKDEESRQGWLKANEEWTKLALQVMERKSTPWDNAANVKFPLLTVASIQFHARAQQALLKGPNPVKAKIIGYDPDGKKKDRADRVGKYLSYQILHAITDWEDDMDRMLMILPFVGLCFKKTYKSVSKNKIVSEVVLAGDLVINYYATDFDTCRKTHWIPLEANRVHELQKLGFYRDIELAEPRMETPGLERELSKVTYTFEGDDIPRIVGECHCSLDLDGDGYKEPWVVTIDKDSGKVLRLSPRFAEEPRRNSQGDITSIAGENLFTRFFFMPDPHSKIYAMGLGNLLGPLNSAVNTLVNQLIDAGTLAVLPSGFLGRGVRNSRGGSMKFRPGEWKQLASTGDDLRKGIYPLPVKEPSSVLFQLLGMLVESGQQVGSIADIMLGENPGQNQPYSTTVQVLEQGMKVFVGIYKRLYRALGKEYKKMYMLTGQEDAELYQTVLDVNALVTADFEDSQFDIVPSSDPDMVAESQKLLKAESLFQKMAGGMPVNVQEATVRILEAEEHDNIEKLTEMPPPQPDFEIQLEAKKHGDLLQLEYDKLGIEKQTAEAEVLKDMSQAAKNYAAAQSTGKADQLKNRDLELRESKDMADGYLKRRQQDVDERTAKKKENKAGV